MSLVWSIGIFQESKDFDPLQQRPEHLVAQFDGRKIRTSRTHAHTYADPFLFPYGDALYLFAEIQNVGQPGHINVWKTVTGAYWQDLGALLKNDTHFSYPYLFYYEDEIYLLPENAGTKKLSLYKFTSFPTAVTLVKHLLDGIFWDSNIYEHNGLWYLMSTNEKNELLLYTADSPLGEWRLHPKAPIQTLPGYSRSGGGFQQIGGKLCRVAQNIGSYYGSGFAIFEVTALSPDDYAETMIGGEYTLARNFAFQKLGRHHYSQAFFKDHLYIAIDGLQKDFIANKFINTLLRFA